MSNDNRAPRTDVVDVFRVVFIPEIRAFGVFDKARRAAN